MSLPTDSAHEMNCQGFEEVFDRYVDETLDAGPREAAFRHVSCCPSCDREVTRWQQTRILLSTAVADLASAVDVSGLRRDVEAALGFAEDAGAGSRPALAARADHGVRTGTTRPGTGAARRPASRSRRGFAAAARFVSAAAVSAAAAAAAVFVLTPDSSSDRGVVAKASAPVSRAASRRLPYQAASFLPASRNAFGEVASAPYTPPPLARPEVSRVDGLEAPAGHLVSTWVQPRTNARVIWVQEQGTGAPVRTAGTRR